MNLNTSPNVYTCGLRQNVVCIAILLLIGNNQLVLIEFVFIPIVFNAKCRQYSKMLFRVTQRGHYKTK